MLDGAIKFSEHKHTFYDEFGNRTNNYIVEKYCKSGDTWNLEETIKTNAGSYFVVNDKFYFLGGNNDSLIPLNMDFNSKDCHACYKVVGSDTEDYTRVIGNEYLCYNKHLNLKLHKQNYSDGTCFYTLEDNRGEFRVNYGNHDLKELVGVLERTIEIDKEYLSKCPHLQENIEQTKKLISDIKQLNLA